MIDFDTYFNPCESSLSFYNGGSHGPRYGDKPWISEQVDLLPITTQQDIKKRYFEIYRSLTGELNQRFRANSWLRKVVEKEKASRTSNGLPF